MLLEHTAGSPVEPGVVWTDLTRADIASEITRRGTKVSVHIVEQLLDEHGYRRRKALKDLPMGASPDRDGQFENIARLRQEFLDKGDPVLSIDTKKRELIGNFCRPGALWARQEVLTFDHDFLEDRRFPPADSPGVVVLSAPDDRGLRKLLAEIDILLRKGPSLAPLGGSKLRVCPGWTA